MTRFILLTVISFWTFNSSHAQAGQVDPAFAYGIVPTRFGESQMQFSSVNKVLLLPDSNMYVLYQHPNLLAKRHPNGTLDVTFGRGGFSPVNIDIADAFLQPDGKVVIAGSKRYEDDYSTGIALVRYNTNGTLDTAFSDRWNSSYSPPGIYREEHTTSIAKGSDGTIVVAVSLRGPGIAIATFVLYQFNADGTRSYKASDPEFNEGHSLAIQSDGKIVVATQVNNGDRTDFFITRYNRGGTRDSSFSKDGKQAIAFTPGLHGVGLQSDGKILAAGVVYVNTGSSLVVARYNTNGTPDATFAGDGEQTVKLGTSCRGEAVAVQNDGKIVVGGQASGGNKSDFFITRFNTDGSLDNGFSEDGKQTTGFGSPTSVTDIQINGKIVAGGSGGNLARYSTDGTLDNTFSKDGKQALELAFHNDNAKSVAVQKDGKVIVVGYAIKNDTSFFLSRYNTNGTTDTTFGMIGQQQIDFGQSIAIQKDGKILVAGSMKTGKGLDFALARYNTNGTPDLTFSKDGKLTTDFEGGDDQATFVDVESDGKIVVGGSVQKRAFYFAAVAKYNTDGTPDNTFSEDGKLTTELQSSPTPSKFIALQSDGKIVVISTGYYVFTIARFNTSGTLDTTFSADGIQTSDFDDNDDYAQAVAIQRDGKIVVAGSSDIFALRFSPSISDPDPFLIILARYNADGSLDTTFSNDGMQRISIATSQESTCCLAIQNDGKIVVAGKSGYGSFAGQDFVLARLNADGSFDKTFGEGGRQITDISGGDDNISDAAIFGNKLYVAGQAGYTGGVVARYLLDDNNSTAPKVSLTSPTNNTSYLAPAAHIKLSASASDANGTISKVEFYNGTHLLHTEYLVPYSFVWRNVPLGNYALTAKAYDNAGLVTTSAPVHISVVPNKPPTVSITKPKNNQPFAAPGYIHFEADAKDVDGRITRVDFYNGWTLLNTQYQFPYTFVWKEVPVGTYTVTAVATDNWGTHDTASLVVRVIPAQMPLISSRAAFVKGKATIEEAAAIRLIPNPARNILNIYITGFVQDKQATLSVISSLGIAIKTMQIRSLNRPVPLDVSSLVSGVYIVKVTSGDRAVYKQFVKLTK